MTDLGVWTTLGVALGLMAAIMTVLWFVSRRIRNASIVDIAWSYGTALLALWFCLQADGPVARRVIVAALAVIWGARLGTHLLQRIAREGEDGRYKDMREEWGDKFEIRTLGFFLIQATWAVIFALPMYLAASNPNALGPADYLAIAFWVISISGEFVADRQLDRFRRDPDNKGKVCQIGLWRYSRHPNYFFEWIHWWAYLCLAVSGGWVWGWFALLGPIVMLIFLLKVTGIPYTEKRALRSRGEAYRRYQQTTSAFVPLPPKRKGATS